MTLDSKTLKKKISSFLKKHKTAVKTISKHDTEVFEAYCFASIGQFYIDRGFKLKATQTFGGYFTFMYSTKSYPWNHSYIEVYDDKNVLVCEIRHNQSVAGNWAVSPSGWYDRTMVGDYVPQYQADIAIVKPGKLPTTKPKTDAHLKKCIASDDLLTFGEVKRMSPTPMLMASFQGMVYMIKPHFAVDSWYTSKSPQSDMKKGKHPYPILFTISYFSANVQNIYDTMIKSQKAHISVVTEALSYDIHDIAKLLTYES